MATRIFVLDQKNAIAGAEPYRKRRLFIGQQADSASDPRHRFDFVRARNGEAAVQTVRIPRELRLSLQLTLDARTDHPDAEARRCRRRNGWSATFDPAQNEAVGS